MKKIPLLVLAAVCLAGCAVNTRYVPYTDQQFAAKSKYYFISVYPESQQKPLSVPYTVIGRVEVSGNASEGVNADRLMDKARAIARARGADAIINARTEVVSYSGVTVIPGYYGYRHYRPSEYVPYSDTSLTFRGELVVVMPERAPEIK